MPPAYPAEALASGAGERTVYLTFTIDESGAVRDVAPTFVRIQIPDRFSEAFLSAAIAAVQRWEFEPARRVYWQKIPGREDRYLYAEKASKRFEVKFTFEASGVVR